MKQRTVLWWLIFFGSALNGIVISNFNIAIVGMVEESPKNTSEVLTSIEKTPTISSHLFDWTPEEQGLALGSLAWLSWVVVVPGAALTNRYGAKVMFGVPHLCCCLLMLIQPLVTYHSFYGLLLIRILLGVLVGFAASPCSAITAKWVPPTERGRFITSILGGTLSVGLGYPFFGWLMSAYGWEAIFYLSGIIGILWFIIWQTFMFNTPDDHPRISVEEKEYINNSLGSTVENRRLPTPWLKILTSLQVLLNLLANIGYVIMLNFTLIYSPTYFKTVHHLDLKSSAILSGLPHILRLILSLITANICDRIIKRQLMSRTAVRRMATFVLTIVAGVTYIALAFSSDNVTVASILIFIAIGTSAFANSGVLAAMVDITPNFVAVIYGIGVTVGSLCVALMPPLVGFALKDTEIVVAWKNIFMAMAGVGIITGVPYVFLANANVVSWNSAAGAKGNEKIQELEVLKTES